MCNLIDRRKWKWKKWGKKWEMGKNGKNAEKKDVNGKKQKNKK